MIGPSESKCTQEVYDFALQLGGAIVSRNLAIVSGGKGGAMEAVCKGAKQSENTFFGATIGILPGDNDKEANEFVDIIIPSGIGIARNTIIINTADVIVSIGGGSGTLSEIAFAWQKGKTIFSFSQFPGWSANLAGTSIDDARSDKIVSVGSLKELMQELDKIGL